ncbi:hypothetical protein OBV_p-00590 (plasmid) [Oscillibacter valericigenes Sjm18-20]|nr:hypothetical protein OBV_p-00590 [Oscillibacter valericigenes Sjm18-20]
MPVTKEMIDEALDFAEGKRINKNGYVPKGARAGDFPENLLLNGKEKTGEQAAVLEYMKGTPQKEILEKCELSFKQPYFNTLRNRYGRMIALYLTWQAFSKFVTPVFNKPLEQVIPIERDGYDLLVVRCNGEGIYTVGGLVQTFTQNNVAEIVKRLKMKRTKTDVFLFIRQACYELL